MDRNISDMRQRCDVEYLQDLQGLAMELAIAIEAIAGNDLPKLQESLAKQEMYCANLGAVANRVGGGSLTTSERSPLQPVSLAQEIRVATDAVTELNLQYAALLKHSGKSIAVLSSLCKSHLGKFQEAPWLKSKHQTWACEA